MPAKKNIKSVIFDFDYTLADSSSGVIECVNYALIRMNLPTPSYEAICKTIGLSFSETFRTLTGERDKIRAGEFNRLFTEQADKVMLNRTVLLDKVNPVIEELNVKGLNLGVVTNKYHYRIEAFLHREQIDYAFQVIVGAEDVQAHKPDPSGLLVAIQQLKHASSESVYVGDSITDAETAHRAGIPFIAVLTGVTTKEQFDEYKPHSIIDTLQSLPGVIE